MARRSTTPEAEGRSRRERLHRDSLLSLEEPERLGALLEANREHQSTVSARLREQMLVALRELTAGFQEADRIADGRILGSYCGEHLQEIYEGLVTVLMRVVFVLHAEERGLLPLDSELHAERCSLTRLYAELHADRTLHGDTIDDRYGAWAKVVGLFRLLHDGGGGDVSVPRRGGALFDPDAYPFLEGRPRNAARHMKEAFDVPRVSDGVVHRVLDQLLVVGGERLRYESLDVEQIGGVYEGLIGFELEIAEGDSLALLPEHVVVDLEAVLRLPGPERVERLRDAADLDLAHRMGRDVKEAETVAELFAALRRRASPRSPGLIPRGALYLQPGEARRKSGSHYTPRSLTQPVVETTLRPLLERLGPDATPEQILDIKICDPAMGSGAFLVEVCRQLADRLALAWKRTRTLPELPDDEELVLHARRLVAQRCVYGVDKNPLAVDLARLSLWLVTFARHHPFTFVDHALRCGDSLVGLSREQIASLSLDAANGAQMTIGHPLIERAVARAEDLRRQVHAVEDPPDVDRVEALRREADAALETARMLGDLVVASVFSEPSNSARRKKLADLAPKTEAWLATGEHEAELRGVVAELREGARHVAPFHWELEFPEVFHHAALPPARGRRAATGGFHAFVGNPPWVSYAGRAAQPLDDGTRRHHAAFYEAFAGYKNLQGLFIERCARLLRPGGRLGLVVPSSMSEQAGYEPTRRAHDRWCACDPDLPDLGNSFAGVFQPCMLLRSTRGSDERAIEEAGAWPVERPDLDAASAALLTHMIGEPLPAALFGERGLQSMGPDTEHLRPEADAEHTVAMRVGGDLEAFRRKAPSLFASPGWFGARLRPAAQWREVRVLIRQTARVPIATLSDGEGFRNSILAGFEDDVYPAAFLVAYLNSTPIRWLHFMRHRDARQGMPQVKIGHLRSIPAPPARGVVGDLAALGAALSARNRGVTGEEQERIDRMVADAFGLSEEQRGVVWRWRESGR